MNPDILSEIVFEYDQEIPQSQTADRPDFVPNCLQMWLIIDDNSRH